MKDILILGDSWGVPEYKKLEREGKPLLGATAKGHTEYLLTEKGYNVYNLSYSGGSNTHTFNRAFNFLQEENVNVDVFIWFHTECYREQNFPGFQTYAFINHNINILYHKIYEKFSDFKFKYPKAKTVVIGGQAPIKDDILHQYITPDYLIKDWRSEILGKEMPEVHTLTNPFEWVYHSRDTVDFKTSLLDKHSIILNAMKESEYFPDDCHPGDKAHNDLTEKLHKVFLEW